jgi:nucleoside-triphosphatase
MAQPVTNLLLTGRSGVGKSTILAKVAAHFETLAVRGFLSSVIYDGPIRTGWRLESIDGAGGTLAHVDIESDHNMGQYGVDMSVFERVTSPQMVLDKEAALYLIDEIGIIAPWSATFIKSMDNLLDSTKLVIAIVRWRDEGYPLTVKQRSDIDLRELTLDNRDEVFQEVVEWIGDRSERLNSTCNA